MENVPELPARWVKLADRSKAKKKTPSEPRESPPINTLRSGDGPAGGTSPSSTSSSPRLSGNDEPASPIDVLLSVLDDIKGEVNDMEKIKPATIQSKLFFKCKISPYNAAREIVVHYSKQLLDKLGPEWQRSPFWDWLKTVASQQHQPLAYTTVEAMPSQLVRRQRNTRVVTGSAAVGTLPTKIDPDKSNGPNHSQGSDRGALDGSSGRSSKSLQPPMAGRRSGKAAGLRLISSSKKRFASDTEGDGDSQGRGRKSAKTSHFLTDDEENAEDSNDSGDVAMTSEDFEDDDGPGAPLPDGAVRIVVHAEKIPSMSPSGPNGTWTCDQEGCGYVVRSAEEPAGKALIERHFKDHETQIEKINLARKESRGHMPIKYVYLPAFCYWLSGFPPH
jgi:hypothetical protein